MMQVFVRGQRRHTLDVEETDTVADVKARVAELEGGNPEDLAVYLCGRPLENEQVLARCASKIQSLEVEVRVLGGKVHGSLARAGKVKGQTPKVEKQEKKKKLTGRAKRREQYNRRLKNEVPSFGKKLGPNSNSR